MDVSSIRDYFTGLQERIVAELEAIEGAPFLRDAWDRPQGGGGISRLIEDGRVFERGQGALRRQLVGCQGRDRWPANSGAAHLHQEDDGPDP